MQNSRWAELVAVCIDLASDIMQAESTKSAASHCVCDDTDSERIAATSVSAAARPTQMRDVATQCRPAHRRDKGDSRRKLDAQFIAERSDSTRSLWDGPLLVSDLRSQQSSAARHGTLRNRYAKAATFVHPSKLPDWVRSLALRLCCRCTPLRAALVWSGNHESVKCRNDGAHRAGNLACTDSAFPKHTARSLLQRNTSPKLQARKSLNDRGLVTYDDFKAARAQGNVPVRTATHSTPRTGAAALPPVPPPSGRRASKSRPAHSAPTAAHSVPTRDSEAGECAQPGTPPLAKPGRAAAELHTPPLRAASLVSPASAPERPVMRRSTSYHRDAPAVSPVDASSACACEPRRARRGAAAHGRGWWQRRL
jgi:hypothetical protein